MGKTVKDSKFRRFDDYEEEFFYTNKKNKLEKSSKRSNKYHSKEIYED